MTNSAYERGLARRLQNQIERAKRLPPAERPGDLIPELVTEDAHAQMLNFRNAPRCEQCGTRLIREFNWNGFLSIIGYRSGSSYCSPACRQSAYRRRKNGGGE